MKIKNFENLGSSPRKTGNENSDDEKHYHRQEGEHKKGAMERKLDDVEDRKVEEELKNMEVNVNDFKKVIESFGSESDFLQAVKEYDNGSTVWPLYSKVLAAGAVVAAWGVEIGVMNPEMWQGIENLGKEAALPAVIIASAAALIDIVRNGLKNNRFEKKMAEASGE